MSTKSKPDPRFDRLCRCLESGDASGAQRAAKLVPPFDSVLHQIFTWSDYPGGPFSVKGLFQYTMTGRELFDLAARAEFKREVKRLVKAADKGERVHAARSRKANATTSS